MMKVTKKLKTNNYFIAGALLLMLLFTLFGYVYRSLQFCIDDYYEYLYGANGIVTGVSSHQCCNPSEFDSLKWKTDESSRTSMLGELTEGKLLGMNPERILEMLGEPDIKYGKIHPLPNDETWHYEMKKGHKHYFAAYFRVGFTDGKVASIEKFLDS